MKRAFLFQGQGSQQVGMGRELYDNYQLVKEIYDEANDIIGENLTSIIFDGPKELLNLTENTQPALMLHSIAILKLIQHLSGKTISQLCNIVAGHSLGEYTAVCAAGMLSLHDTIKLLKLRGKSMQNAVAVGEGAMAAMLGMEYEEVVEITALASQKGICEIANDNCIGQIVISGVISAIDEAINIAKNRGKKAIKLEVSAPFHCSLMNPVQEIMKNALDLVSFEQPQVPIITNVEALPTTDIDEIKRLLVKQISSSVNWRQSILYLVNDGIIKHYEIGTGKVLVGLNKRIDERIESVALNTPKAIEDFVNGL